MTDLAGKRILLVEDEALIAMMVEAALAEMGCASMHAATFNAAKRLALSGQFDAGILDIDLAGESVSTIADVLSARNIPFLFATGLADDETIAPAHRRRPVVLKPYTDDELRAGLELALAPV